MSQDMLPFSGTASHSLLNLSGLITTRRQISRKYPFQIRMKISKRPRMFENRSKSDFRI